MPSPIFKAIYANAGTSGDVAFSHVQLAIVQPDGTVGNQMGNPPTPSPANIDVGANGGAVDFGLVEGKFYAVSFTEVPDPTPAPPPEQAPAEEPPAQP
jgi:hypothetical protein